MKTPANAARAGKVSRPAFVALSVVLLGLSIYFRLPVLMNAHGLNSDVAVVGLQAAHVRNGEWAPFLWGSGYQSSTDSVVAALWFALFGSAPWALLASALSMHLALTWGTFGLLARRIGLASAFVLALVLVFTTPPIHSFALYPPREASLFLMFVAFFVVDGAAEAKRPFVRLALAGLFAGLACYADPYARLLYPTWFTWAMLTSFDRVASAKHHARWAATVLLAAAVGLMPDLFLRHARGASEGPMGLSLNVLEHNWKLLWEVCGPWAFGTRPLYAPGAAGYGPWPIPTWLVWFARIGALVFFLASASGVGLALTRSRIPWNVRRLGIVGACGVFGTFAAFLVSVMVMDHFSMRYLAAAFLVAPFAMTPLGWLLRRRVYAIAGLLAPYLVASAVCGWVAYAPYYRGALPVRDAMGQGTPDYDLQRYLHAQHIDYAMADYWASYRLTFLYREAPVVIPKNASEDRYAPYRQAFTASKRVAYIYDPARSRESETERALSVAELGTLREQARVGAFTVYIVER